MLKKRAQGLTIRFIILAIISLIILVVLLSILSGRIGNFVGVVKESQSCNQICQIEDYSGGISDGPKSGYKILLGARDSEGQCYCKT